MLEYDAEIPFDGAGRLFVARTPLRDFSVSLYHFSHPPNECVYVCTKDSRHKELHPELSNQR
jgi:hypothetical protein